MDHASGAVAPEDALGPAVLHVVRRAAVHAPLSHQLHCP